MQRFLTTDGLRLPPYCAPSTPLQAVEGFAQQDPSVQKWTKKEVANLIKVGGLGPVVVGSPTSLADQLQSWVDDADVDGFNLAYALAPGTFVDFIDLVVPVLQERGKVWNDYPAPSNAAPDGWPAHKAEGSGAPRGFGQEEPLGLTAREKLYGQRRLRDDHYGSVFKWGAGQPAPQLSKLGTQAANGHAGDAAGAAAKGHINGSDRGGETVSQKKQRVQ